MPNSPTTHEIMARRIREIEESAQLDLDEAVTSLAGPPAGPPLDSATLARASRALAVASAKMRAAEEIQRVMEATT